MIAQANELLGQIRAIHETIRDRVVASCKQQAIEQLAEIVSVQAGDTIFALDRVSEQALIECFTELGRERSFVLIAEGLGEDGVRTFPAGTSAEDAELRIIIDPIDGTRGIVYQKRAAWILTGVAPNHGPHTSLLDIELAVQTEVPVVKQYLSDTFWAIAGQGAHGERVNLLTGERQAYQPHPSHAPSIEYGFGNIARFFPGGRAELATIDDLLVERVLGPIQSGLAQAYEDQYLATGGQFSELLNGHDRWIADLRPLIERKQATRLGLLCHPYDVCTELICREAGLIITDASGERLAAPLDVDTGVAWIGYANQTIHDQVAPVLHSILRERGLLDALSLL